MFETILKTVPAIKYVALAHKLGIKVAAFFVIGLPGETLKNIEMTIRYGRELTKASMDETAFALFIPLRDPVMGQTQG